MKDIKVWLATDRLGKANVLYVTGGTFDDPLNMGEIDEAAREQVPLEDYNDWRFKHGKFLRYSPDGSGH